MIRGAHGHPDRRRGWWADAEAPAPPARSRIVDTRCAVCAARLVETVNRYGTFWSCAVCDQARDEDGSVPPEYDRGACPF